MERRSTPASGIRLARGGTRLPRRGAAISPIHPFRELSNVSEANGTATITAQNTGGGPLGTWTGGILSTDTTKIFTVRVL